MKNLDLSVKVCKFFTGKIYILHYLLVKWDEAESPWVNFGRKTRCFTLTQLLEVFYGARSSY